MALIVSILNFMFAAQLYHQCVKQWNSILHKRWICWHMYIVYMWQADIIALTSMLKGWETVAHIHRAAERQADRLTDRFDSVIWGKYWSAWINQRSIDGSIWFSVRAALRNLLTNESLAYAIFGQSTVIPTPIDFIVAWTVAFAVASASCGDGCPSVYDANMTGVVIK